MSLHTYENWNSRPFDNKEQEEPYRKYFIICEGANTETFYFKRLIDLRKELGINPLIDIRLWEETGDKRGTLSYPKNLTDFAMDQKNVEENDFDKERDKLIIVFDGDIFENKVKDYDDLIAYIEENDIAAVSNPGFELYLILHVKDSYENYIKGHEKDFFSKDEKDRYSYAYKVLLEITGMNAKKNPHISSLADNAHTAIEQEKMINEDIHNLKEK